MTALWSVQELKKNTLYIQTKDIWEFGLLPLPSPSLFPLTNLCVMSFVQKNQEIPMRGGKSAGKSQNHVKWRHMTSWRQKVHAFYINILFVWISWRKFNYVLNGLLATSYLEFALFNV